MPLAKTLFYECFAGIAGDMHLGALLDVGVPVEHLRTQLAKLELAGEFELVVERAAKMGITGTRATVRLAANVAKPARHLATIKGIVERAGYPPLVMETAFAMFQAIAEAEAKIHGLSVEQIHFHEVGATDSIVDVVGAAIGLRYLAADAIRCNEVEVGSGMVRCEHGLLPVPAPATAEILKGIPCRYGGVEGEATTPTGAAILKTVVDEFAPPPSFKPTAIGYGIGQRDFARPNVLRLTLGETAVPTLETQTNLHLECNIDDMPAEAFAPLMEALFAKGAKDVFLTPIVMKKSRPGTKISVLADETTLDAVLAELFAASTTIGVRMHPVRKRMLRRQQRVVDTSHGHVRVKIATLPSGGRRWKSEHDDIAAIANRQGRDYLSTKADVDREIERILEDGHG